MARLATNGVPPSIVTDGWWLGAMDHEATRPPTDTTAISRTQAFWRRPMVLLAVLVLFADFLFFDERIGLSLAIFAIALIAAIWVQTDTRPDWRVLTALVVSVLPVIVHVQLLSVMILLAGVLAVAVRAGLQETDWGKVAAAAIRVSIFGPIWSAIDGTDHLLRRSVFSPRKDVASLRRGWLLPLLLGAVFIALITNANPVLQDLWHEVARLDFHLLTLVQHSAFWAVVAVLIWPLMTMVRRRAEYLAPLPSVTVPSVQSARFGINPASIANSLALFNLIFAVQSGLDLTYLWGGADLPAGLSHAQYAHRGAYPLLATALLAGAFVLISRPYTDGRPLLRALLLLWIGQNLLLVLSSIYRLDLYIDAYGLTYLRIRAGIWMVLVAAGLALTAWQLWRGKSNLWLLKCNTVLLAGVLYLCCFVNFAHLIAEQNLSRDTTTRALDRRYLCALGPMAAAAFSDHRLATEENICPNLRPPVIHGWRDWGFRSWHVYSYSGGNDWFLGAALENPDRG